MTTPTTTVNKSTGNKMRLSSENTVYPMGSPEWAKALPKLVAPKIGNSEKAISGKCDGFLITFGKSVAGVFPDGYNLDGVEKALAYVNSEIHKALIFGRQANA